MRFSNLLEEVQFCFIFSAITEKEVSTGRIKSYLTHRFISQLNPSIKQYFLELPFRDRVSNVYEVVRLVYFIPNELQINVAVRETPISQVLSSIDNKDLFKTKRAGPLIS